MEPFIRGVATLSRLCGLAAGALIGVSVLVVTHMVATRYLFGLPTIWQTECVTFSIVAATLLGSPYVLLSRGHVNMDILPLYAGPRLRWWLALVAGAGALLFVLLMTWYGAHLWLEAWTADWHSDSLWRVPLWIPYAALPVGMGVLALQYVADILALITGRAPPFGLPPTRGADALSASTLSLHAEPHR